MPIQQDLFSPKKVKLLTERTNFYFIGGTEQQRNHMYYELPALLDKTVIGLEPITIEGKDGHVVPYVLTVEELGRIAGYCNNLGLDMLVSIMGKMYKVQNPKGTSHMYYIGAIEYREPNRIYGTHGVIDMTGTEFLIK